jgi:hypothetical protein
MMSVHRTRRWSDVTPAPAGVQEAIVPSLTLDSRLRGNDEEKREGAPTAGG